MAFTAGDYVTTLAQVNDFFRDFPITDSTQPSTTDVSEAIAEVEAELNVALRDQNYSVPLTNTDDIEWARSYCKEYAALKVFYQMWSGGTLGEKWKYIAERWQKLLDRIYKGQISLAGETALGDDDPYFTTARTPNRSQYWSTSVED